MNKEMTPDELEINNAQLWLSRISGVAELISFWNLYGSNPHPYPDIER